MTSISKNILTKQQLLRPSGGQVHFNDVFSEKSTANDIEWWRKCDFDAEITQLIESSNGAPFNYQIPIGLRQQQANYGLVLLDDLVWARNKRVEEAHEQNRHPDQIRESQSVDSAMIAVANKAPRDNKNTASGSNGSDFYLAITHNGLEIYATPLTFLSELESRSRIRTLYRIPTELHPEFNSNEQFRSARIVRSRRHFDHLVPVYDYVSKKELIEAKKSGDHRTVIPGSQQNLKIAHIDKFGNVIVELKDKNIILDSEIGKSLRLKVSTKEKIFETSVVVVRDLRSAPTGEFAVYINCSNPQDVESNVGFVELMVRVDEDPNISKKTAIYKLKELAGDFDIESTCIWVE